MHSDSQGKAVIFSAPSGAGKTTIVRHLLEYSELNLAFSVSATSRKPRGIEQDGVDYHFLSVEAFQARIDSGALVEWEEVYPGKFYGTLQAELERLWAAGKTVVFDVDVVGGANLRRLLGDSALAIFIQPPSLKVLRQRLESRGTDDPERIEERLAKAQWELEQHVHFDKVLINDDLTAAQAQAVEWLKAYNGNFLSA
ncbi:MAG: guanylate kinase [Flavobacteriales bacterium]|nr:guanylate kinase [Crocinitomicaceae bacterium]MBO74028.1 guanylate kinase [Flavobacteriales bacterium]|tara:strand:- start:178 stop:771 length:594 start_codon:yes stop_codon:yes gene_type:complete